MKNRLIISGLLALSVAPNVFANDSKHALELGVSYSDASGFNAYGTDNARNVFCDKTSKDEGCKRFESVHFIYGLGPIKFRG